MKNGKVESREGHSGKGNGVKEGPDTGKYKMCLGSGMEIIWWRFGSGLGLGRPRKVGQDQIMEHLECQME